MMPRIDAGERLAAITDRTLAACGYSRIEAWRIERNLREAESGKRRRAAKATPAVLKGMGIGLRSVGPTASLHEVGVPAVNHG